MNSEVPVKYYFDRMGYIQWVEKLFVQPLQLFSFFLFRFMETNFGASISDIL